MYQSRKAIYRKILRILLIRFPAMFILTSLILVLFLKNGRITWTPLMLRRDIEFRDGKGLSSHRAKWTALEDFSPALISAVITSEDARFYSHNGFDWEEIRRMWYRHKHMDGPLRGCSTISQQTARNLFTFCSSTLLRKVLEAWWTVLIERFWNKDRILEVYLNIVETGPGLYGIPAATAAYFKCPPKELGIHDACTLVLCLPEPLRRTPGWVWDNMPARLEELYRTITVHHPQHLRHFIHT